MEINCRTELKNIIQKKDQWKNYLEDDGLHDPLVLASLSGESQELCILVAKDELVFGVLPLLLSC